MRRNAARRVVSAIALIGVILQASPSQAQISTDGSLGGRQVLSGPAFDIPATLGQQRGPNLFHSFGAFNIRTGESATFSGPASVQNIISRVTGGEASHIDGQLGSSIAGANFYLLNPSGVLTGPNASLNVSGSVHLTTADTLRFADGKVFSVSATAPVLTVAQPAAFGFLSAAPARILVDGSKLSVQSGQTLSVIGGEVEIKGPGATLAAPGGRVQIASLSSGKVTLDGRVTPSSRLGPIKITNALIGAAELNEDFGIGFGSGTVVIRGGQLLVDASTIAAHTWEDVAGPRLIDIQVTGDVILTNGANISSATFVADRGGDVTITADRLRLENQSLLETKAFAEGDGGDVTATVGRLEVAGSSSIGSTTGATGHGGKITVKADAVTISGPGSQIFSDAQADGNGGKVSIVPRSSTLDLVLDDVGSIKSDTLFGAGSGGDIEVKQATSVSLLGGATISSLTTTSAPGGSIALTANSVTISGGDSSNSGARSGLLSGSVGAGDTGSPGKISVTATNFTLTQGGVIESGGFFAPEAGDIEVAATNSLVISSGGTISSQAFARPGGQVSLVASTASMDGGFVNTSTIGAGPAGNVVIDVGTLTMSNGAQVASSSSRNSTAPGGSVTVKAGSVAIAGTGTSISSVTQDQSTGSAGTVTVTAHALTISDHGKISVESTTAASAGDITLALDNTLSLSGGSGVFSNATSSGPGGQVSLVAPTATVSMDGGFINTSATGTSAAGNIALDVTTLTMSNGAQVASSSAGVASAHGGSVTVKASDSVAIAGAGSTINSFTNDASTGLFSTTASHDPAGSAGTVVVTAPALTISDRGKISVESTGAASAGAITLSVNTLSLSGGAGLFSNATSSGPGGNINVQAGQVQLASGATISASSSGTGLAGSLTLRATTFQSQDSFVTTAATQADGGDIDILVGSLLYLRGSEIVTSVGSGLGKGGNITIDPQFVVLNNSQIRADAFGGPGGNITIVTDVFLSSGSIVSASSALSAPGTINIDARITDLSDSLVQLPDNVLQAASLLRAACTARVAEGKASSLVVAGREGVPPEPEGLLWSPLGAALSDLNATPHAAHERELLPRFAGVWLGSNCAR